MRFCQPPTECSQGLSFLQQVAQDERSRLQAEPGRVECRDQEGDASVAIGDIDRYVDDFASGRSPELVVEEHAIGLTGVHEKQVRGAVYGVLDSDSQEV